MHLHRNADYEQLKSSSMFTNQLKMQLRRTSAGLLLFAVCLLCHTACTDESFREDAQQTGRAIRISAALPHDPVLTKAAQPKESFAAGDVIHVYAQFILAGGISSTAYACMKFDGVNWTASDGTTLTWPWNAVSGTFTAYYIPPVTVAGTEWKNNTAMSNDANRNELGFSLSDLTKAAIEKGADPMLATYTDIPAESAVHLQFAHLFAKLTFVNLGKEENDAADLADKEILYLSAAGLEDSCVFARQAGGDALSAALKPNKGYIAGQAEPESSGGSYRVTFLIPPVTALQTEFKLFFKDFTPYHLVPVKQPLEAGRHYSVDITKLADNYWSDDLKEEAWNKDQTPVTLETADINAYLTAIRDGEEYRKDGIQILDVYTEVKNGKTTTVVTQLRDVDFGNRSFTPVHISTNIIFQGNGHKVKNLFVQSSIDENGNAGTDYRALFGENAGVIRNLRIEGAKTNESDAKNVGILVGFNKGTGIIENVRVDFNTGDLVKGSSGTLYIGGLAGVNEGEIANCTLRGNDFHVQVAAGVTGQSCYAGGIIGYNSGTSSHVREARIQAENATVTYNGAGNYVYIGGWAGYSDSERVEACSSSLGVSVDAGGEMHAGGFAGKLYGTVKTCSATGGVTLLATAVTAADGGGFAGLAVNVRLSACYATGTITGGGSGASLGGFAGRIEYEGTGTSDVLNCFAIGQVPDGTAGGFAAASNDAAQVSVRNCFSRNRATAFIGNDGATLVAVHHNGEVNGASVSTAELNNSKPAGGFEWVNSPDLYGGGFPYFIIH